MPSQPIARPIALPNTKQKTHMTNHHSSNNARAPMSATLMAPKPATLPDPVPPVVSAPPHVRHTSPDVDHNVTSAVEGSQFNGATALSISAVPGSRAPNSDPLPKF